MCKSFIDLNSSMRLVVALLEMCYHFTLALQRKIWGNFAIGGPSFNVKWNNSIYYHVDKSLNYYGWWYLAYISITLFDWTPKEEKGTGRENTIVSLCGTTRKMDKILKLKSRTSHFCSSSFILIIYLCRKKILRYYFYFKYQIWYNYLIIFYNYWV